MKYLYKLINHKNGDTIDGYTNRFDAIKYLINNYKMVTIDTEIITNTISNKEYKWTLCTCFSETECAKHFKIECYEPKTNMSVTWEDEENELKGEN